VKDDLVLRQICLETYFPTGAVKARQESFEAHENHWFVAFIYWTPALSEPLEYGSYKLLDGRMLEDTIRHWPWVDRDAFRPPKPK